MPKHNRISWILNRCLDLLFPERCAMCDRVIEASRYAICADCRKIIPLICEPKCKKCGRQIRHDDEEYCADCARMVHSYNRGVCLLVYDELVSHSMYRFKYGNRQRYAAFFGDEIARRLGREILGFNAQVIVPVPLHKKRLKMRGYNQAYLLAKRIGERLSIPVRDDIVYRAKNTKALKVLNPSQRQNNLKGAFKLGADSVKYCSIILVDDIYTTGSTVDEISSLLKRAGARCVYFIAVATGMSNK